MPVWLRPIEFRVEGRDRLRPLTWTALGGLVLGAVMAVFGLPPVDVHGPLHYLGIMDPLCGGTRSVWAAMSGDPATSWRYNPLGIVLVAGAAGTIVRFVLGAVTGRWINVRVRSWETVVAVGSTLFGVLAVRQQMNADLLSSPPGSFSPVGPLLNALPVLVMLVWLNVRRRRMTAANTRR
ncbi:DUF2752 domain-containing protein [Nocardiopsis sp. YSL2]|uniref:DUF2752 domain-containing protein n=1 Tax=Nocardiopsis sp. YSL2 TaxID=2939492 RepID=UPI0026F43C70|nr:DUF2752 domain-containing protein [Nocardiopsis sp. YSL2]